MPEEESTTKNMNFRVEQNHRKMLTEVYQFRAFIFNEKRTIEKLRETSNVDERTRVQKY